MKLFRRAYKIYKRKLFPLVDNLKRRLRSPLWYDLHFVHLSKYSFVIRRKKRSGVYLQGKKLKLKRKLRILFSN